ncbi:hypothetical protein [Acinetobacter sp. NCu2D-2]|uniref:hypothetical protein n=1 Tax=Acinetobacter sp. NCu2D-2 TaxID=1608473 RepID=UPI000AFB3DB5|nr:hypothetical protein [Acinetobacter sp. NCu2D-2]
MKLVKLTFAGLALVASLNVLANEAPASEAVDATTANEAPASEAAPAADSKN